MNTSKSIKKNWYLVYCKPRQEVSARVNLERQGYEVYLPMIRTRKRGQVNKTLCLQAMFPRYLFIRLSKILDNWAPIRSTVGVSHLVKFGLELATLPNELIETLILNSGVDGIFEAKQVKLKVGDRCRIADGIMADYEGIVLAHTGKDRVKLMLNSIKSSIYNFEISKDQLEFVC